MAAIFLACHDLDCSVREFVNLKAGIVEINLSAPGPLPDPYVGDDLRNAQLVIRVEGTTLELTAALSAGQMKAFAMGVRQAAVHMEGKR